MSIKKKLIISMLLAFIGNIIFVIGFFEVNVSKEMIQNFKDEQLKLDNQINEIIKDIENGHTVEELAKELEKSNNNLIYFFNDRNENRIYKSKMYNSNMINRDILNQQVTAIINKDNRNILIELVKPVNIKTLLVIKPMKTLLKAELVILSIILIFLALMIYFNLVKPIEILSDSMAKYKVGLKPKKIKRHDEIGWVHNCFVDLAEDIDRERDKQNRIIASISHDIKTPLTSVMGFAERLQSGKVEEERKKKYLKIIYSKSEHIKDIINEFDEYLDYNLQRDINIDEISLGKFCDNIRYEYYDELTEAGIDFNIECGDRDSILNIDIAKVRRVFGNIINNSIKHKREENLNIKIKAKKINGYALFQISDNGEGIAEENIEKIFEPLYTSDKSRKVAGLGLSICRNIIESHSGKIWAENNENYGLSIFFTIRDKNKIFNR
mgnify:CR=1 FL=1